MTWDLTIAVTTFRAQPRFGLFFHTLERELLLGLRRNVAIEILVVDGMLWSDPIRADHLRDVVATVSPTIGTIAPVIHVPPKPSVWQGPTRLTQQDEWDAASARNTAIALARGQQIAFVDDCMALAPGWLQSHMKAMREGYALAGSYVSVRGGEISDGRLTGHSVIPGAFDHRAHEQFSLGPCSPGWLYGCNQSYPIAAAIEINGWDEMYSGQGGVEDCDFGIRLGRAGVEVMFDGTCAVLQVCDTHTELFGHAGPERTSTYTEPPRRRHTPKNRKLPNGLVKYANEFLTYRLQTEDRARVQPLLYPSGDVPLHQLRGLGNETTPWPVPAYPEFDWRDGAPLSDLWCFAEGRGTPADLRRARVLSGAEA